MRPRECAFSAGLWFIPGKDITWSTVKNVVDRREPENSLLLRKPTSTAESEGVANARATAHGGGQRWAKGSPEYETILKWVQGAK